MSENEQEPVITARLRNGFADLDLNYEVLTTYTLEQRRALQHLLLNAVCWVDDTIGRVGGRFDGGPVLNVSLDPAHPLVYQAPGEDIADTLADASEAAVAAGVVREILRGELVWEVIGTEHEPATPPPGRNEAS